MSSKNDIQNYALIYLEERPTTNIEDTAAGNIISILYNSVYTQMLKKNTCGWTFARKIKTLGQISNPVEFNGYSNAYLLPSDFLLTIQSLNTTNTFIIIGNLVYSNDSSFKMLYIFKVDESLVSDEFAHAVSYDLASRASGIVSGKVEIKQDLMVRAGTELKKAISLDLALMDTQQYMPRTNTMYFSKFRSGFNMASVSNLARTNNDNGN